MTAFRVDRRISNGLVMINGLLWGRVKARKRMTCAISGRPISPGDLVYRPQTNGDTRMYRALASVVDLPTPPSRGEGV